VLNLLQDLQDEFKLTYVFISHDLSVVRHIADDVMVMYFGEAVEQGPRDEVFNNPQHSYTRTLFAATPRVDIDAIKARVACRKAA
jgi:dipeptide transport system ATP-binding protein